MRSTPAAALVAAFFSAALVAVFFMAAPAEAQMVPRQMRVPCSDAEYLPDLLAREYGEAPAEQGVANGALVQLWRNVGENTWTIVLVTPDGMACALASGEDWMDAAPPKGEGT